MYSRGVRIGNWVEEGALGSEVDTTSTFRRTVSNFEPNDKLESSTQSAYRKHASSQEKEKFVSREQLMRKKFEQQAIAELEKEDKKKEKEENEWDGRSLAQVTYTGHTTFGQIGKRILKSVDGTPCVPDKEFMKQTGFRAGAAKLPEEPVSKEPVSIYTRGYHRFPASAAESSNPFAKSTGFSNQIGDSSKTHFDT